MGLQELQPTYYAKRNINEFVG